MTVTEFGGRIVTLKCPDRYGKTADITLGYDTLDEYLKETAYFGALIGRYGNRIGNGKIVLNGSTYQITKNEGANTLHSASGYHNSAWKADEQSISADSVQLHLHDPDGKDGYPGNLDIKVRYSLIDTDLRIDYHATTDRDTVVNMTSHGYFNLAGAGHPTVLDHQLTLHADQFTPVSSTLIPTGELRAVPGSPFDFRQSRRMGERIDQADEQLKNGFGYDHNWVLNNQSGQLALAAEVHDPASGRVMQVLTTEPGIQFYSGNHLNGMIGKSGQRYAKRSGYCLETQHYPDSPNHPNFPSTTLKRDEVYQSTTIYRLSSK
jgi:aldose 1-epimerase